MLPAAHVWRYVSCRARAASSAGRRKEPCIKNWQIPIGCDARNYVRRSWSIWLNFGFAIKVEPTLMAG